MKGDWVDSEKLLLQKADIAVAIAKLRFPTGPNADIEDYAVRLLDYDPSEEALELLRIEAHQYKAARSRLLSVLEAYRDFPFRTGWERLPLDL